jgi:hypothetical protein
MTVTYVHGGTIGDGLPGLQLPLINVMGDLQARITAMASFAPSITPPSIAADIQVSGQILANLQASAALGIEPPSVDLQVDIMADVLLAARLQLEIIMGLFDALGTAGLHLYRYDGQTADLGGEFTAELSGGVPGGSGTDSANALLLITTVPATWAALAQLFKVTP